MMKKEEYQEVQKELMQILYKIAESLFEPIKHRLSVTSPKSTASTGSTENV